MAEPEEEAGANANANAYLALREAKIARNHARLLELGLVTRRCITTTTSTVHAANTEPPSFSKKRKHVANNGVALPSAMPERRSLRIRGSPTDYAETPVDSEAGKKGSSTEPFHSAKFASNPHSSSEPLTLDQLKAMDDSYSPQQRPIPHPSLSNVTKNSARAMHLNVKILLFGSQHYDDDDGLLGVRLQATGKAFVMEESTRRAVCSDQHESGPISFNKYSGVQEWGNDVLYLWVNLDAPNGELVNEFPNGGRQVTWFGGGKMHDGTSAIRKLKRVGVDAATGKGDPVNQGVVLWCRQYDKVRKAFGAYACLGRLSLVSYDPTSRPLAFVWNLLDYENLVAHKNKHVQETFRKLTGAV